MIKNFKIHHPILIILCGEIDLLAISQIFNTLFQLYLQYVFYASLGSTVLPLFQLPLLKYCSCFENHSPNSDLTPSERNFSLFSCNVVSMMHLAIIHVRLPGVSDKCRCPISSHRFINLLPNAMIKNSLHVSFLFFFISDTSFYLY